MKVEFRDEEQYRYMLRCLNHFGLKQVMTDLYIDNAFSSLKFGNEAKLSASFSLSKNEINTILNELEVIRKKGGEFKNGDFVFEYGEFADFGNMLIAIRDDCVLGQVLKLY